jgi:predicted NBD/HSP70 family sugar kinase
MTATDGRGNSELRRHNLSLVLRLAHESQGVPRSTLTRKTGLNRSTIAALVGELVDRGLLVEVEPDPNYQVGRPSPLAVPSPRAIGIAVNPEIDAITVGVVGLGGRVLGRRRLPTGGVPSVEEAIAQSASAIAELRAEFADHQVVGIGVAVPGLVRARDGLVRLAPHLGWNDQPFAGLLEEATGLPVRAANDASLGILAESTFGAGRGVDDLIYLNGGSSGIGGGIKSSGRVLGGADGYAGELGHTLVNSTGALCHCGATGCLETEVRRDRLLVLLGLDDADDDGFESALLASTAPEVRAEVKRQLNYLAVALRNAINVLNPSKVVLGGFLAALYAAAPDHLDDLVAAQPLTASRESMRIGRAELGTNLLMIGAGDLAFETVLDDPQVFGTLG